MSAAGAGPGAFMMNVGVSAVAEVPETSEKNVYNCKGQGAFAHVGQYNFDQSGNPYGYYWGYLGANQDVRSIAGADGGQTMWAYGWIYDFNWNAEHAWVTYVDEVLTQDQFVFSEESLDLAETKVLQASVQDVYTKAAHPATIQISWRGYGDRVRQWTDQGSIRGLASALWFFRDQWNSLREGRYAVATITIDAPDVGYHSVIVPPNNDYCYSGLYCGAEHSVWMSRQ